MAVNDNAEDESFDIMTEWILPLTQSLKSVADSQYW